MIDGKIFFDEAIHTDKTTYENIKKIATGQGGDYTTGCLLDYSHFKENCKTIAIDLSKPQALYADPKEVQQIQSSTLLQIKIKCEIKAKKSPRLFARNCNFEL